MTTKELGDLGEKIAIQFLREKGLEIVCTNYRFHHNEVDIIYKLSDKYVFVEVKTRQTNEIGPPWKAVTKSKQKQIIKCAHEYLVSHDLEEEAQFDIISIVHNSYGTNIEHIEDAFYPMR
ncbi:MAG: YraN family protein [Brumimicrobium sp.]|nr:YraN family protein [Brumimicrobium sp.]MCO5269190.1 YraN family protein [Brumimicrobium sp.]